jgi:hypothetical protein
VVERSLSTSSGSGGGGATSGGAFSRRGMTVTKRESFSPDAGAVAKDAAAAASSVAIGEADCTIGTRGIEGKTVPEYHGARCSRSTTSDPREEACGGARVSFDTGGNAGDDADTLGVKGGDVDGNSGAFGVSAGATGIGGGG